MKLHVKYLKLSRKETDEFSIILNNLFHRILANQKYLRILGKLKLILSTSKMCTDENKLRFILSDFSAIRGLNQA